MKDDINLGELEILVLNIIWDNPKSTVKEIHNKVMDSGKKSARTTVLTIIQNLEKKKFIKRSSGTGVASYTATKKKTSVLTNISRRFRNVMLGGSMTPMVQSFLDENPSKEELEKIRKMIDAHTEKKGEES